MVIPTIVRREDTPEMGVKADLVNAHLQYRYINQERIFIRDNGNLYPSKFRVDDGVHLNDHGTAVYATNLKHKIADALKIEVIEKKKYPQRGHNNHDHRQGRRRFFERR